ncbi:tetratricopeptide repeat protein [Congregicoccus parvus]|uniref:tetratricopeptide repeat protein n=1 Tax=Congregicoccus parvus TaxID=3081749 RepID=UPI003FA5704D
MRNASAHTPPFSRFRPGTTGVTAAALGALLFIAYHGVLDVPFLFDDIPTVLENASIRDAGDWLAVLSPAGLGGATSAGRPLVNASMALNYAVSGQAVWSYHVFNLLVHGAATLALFGLVRRTLARVEAGEHDEPAPTSAAAACAAIWMLHPVQTICVTYVSQRAEAMAALFVLLTLYAFVRSVGAPHPLRWRAAATTACACGMACKETAVVAPILVLLFDRAFVAGDFRAALRERRRFHVALASTWLLLGALVFAAGDRGGTAGFGVGVTPWQYALTQVEAVVHYLRLAIWPRLLVFDHGTPLAGGVSAVWIHLIVLLALLAATIHAVVHRLRTGFVAASFFLLLAPSSSVVPIATQTMGEHRLYLALAAPVVLCVLFARRFARPITAPLLAVVIVGCTAATILRNRDYESALTIWADTVEKRPFNARAHLNLGQALFEAGRTEEALVAYTEAVRLRPEEPEPHYNRGLALSRARRFDEALVAYDEALRLRPAYPDFHVNRGVVLLALGRPREAHAAFAEAARLRPDHVDAWANLAGVLLDLGRSDEALSAAERALALDPTHAEAALHAGNALASRGRFAAAAARYEQSLRIRPGHAGTLHNLGNVLLELDRPDEAVARWEEALAADPDLVDARRVLGLVLAATGRGREALPHLQKALEARPEDAQVRAEVARLRRDAGR